MERKCLLISSANENVFENTLQSFSNLIPQNYIKTQKSWKACVESIGIHLQLVNNGVSQGNKYAAMICIPQNALTMEMFTSSPDDSYAEFKFHSDILRRHHLYYLNPCESYNLKTLNEQFRSECIKHTHEDLNNFVGFPTMYNEEKNLLIFGQHEFPFRSFGREGHQFQTIMMLHKNFMQCLEFQQDPFLPNGAWKEMMIGDQVYYWAFCFQDGRNELKVTGCDKLVINFPKVIKIVSPSIKPILTDGSFSNEMKLCTVYKRDLNNFTTIDFKTTEWFDLAEQNPNKFQIQFLDHRNLPLRLRSGFPSTCKIHLSSEEMDHLDLRVTSKPNAGFSENKPYYFRQRLAHRQNLTDGVWKAGLTSAIFRNRFLILKNLKLNFCIKVPGTTIEETFETPRSLSNVNDVIEFFTNTVKDYIKVDKLLGGHVMLTFVKTAALELGHDLCKLLGGGDEYQDILVVSTRQTCNIYKPEGGKYVFNFPPELHFPLFPENIFVYLNVLKESLVGDSLSKLLKVIPLPNHSKNEYISLEFENPEFIPISQTELCEMEFQLRTHNGEYVQIYDDEPVYFNIVLKKD